MANPKKKGGGAVESLCAKDRALQRRAQQLQRQREREEKRAAAVRERTAKRQARDDERLRARQAREIAALTSAAAKPGAPRPAKPPRPSSPKASAGKKPRKGSAVDFYERIKANTEALYSGQISHDEHKAAQAVIWRELGAFPGRTARDVTKKEKAVLALLRADLPGALPTVPDMAPPAARPRKGPSPWPSHPVDESTPVGTRVEVRMPGLRRTDPDRLLPGIVVLQRRGTGRLRVRLDADGSEKDLMPAQLNARGSVDLVLPTIPTEPGMLPGRESWLARGEFVRSVLRALKLPSQVFNAYSGRIDDAMVVGKPLDPILAEAAAESPLSPEALQRWHESLLRRGREAAAASAQGPEGWPPHPVKKRPPEGTPVEVQLRNPVRLTRGSVVAGGGSDEVAMVRLDNGVIEEVPLARINKLGSAPRSRKMPGEGVHAAVADLLPRLTAKGVDAFARHLKQEKAGPEAARAVLAEALRDDDAPESVRAFDEAAARLAPRSRKMPGAGVHVAVVDLLPRLTAKGVDAFARYLEQEKPGPARARAVLEEALGDDFPPESVGAFEEHAGWLDRDVPPAEVVPPRPPMGREEAERFAAMTTLSGLYRPAIMTVLEHVDRREFEKAMDWPLKWALKDAEELGLIAPTSMGLFRVTPTGDEVLRDARRAAREPPVKDCGDVCDIMMPEGICGAKAAVLLPSPHGGPREVRTRYCLVNADKIITSHDPDSFAPDPRTRRRSRSGATTRTGPSRRRWSRSPSRRARSSCSRPRRAPSTAPRSSRRRGSPWVATEDRWASGGRTAPRGDAARSSRTS